MPLVCADDAKAIENAKRLADATPVEVWNGERFVIRLSPTEKSGDTAVTYEVKDGRLVPKSKSKAVERASGRQATSPNCGAQKAGARRNEKSREASVNRLAKQSKPLKLLSGPRHR
jgi:hypothetical protein